MRLIAKRRLEGHSMRRLIFSAIVLHLGFANLHGAEFSHKSGKSQGTSVHRQTYARHLVLDSRKIASTSNVKLVLGKIKKHPANPLFGEKKPWEQRFDNFYGSIV